MSMNQVDYQVRWQQIFRLDNGVCRGMRTQDDFWACFLRVFAYTITALSATLVGQCGRPSESCPAGGPCANRGNFELLNRHKRCGPWWTRLCVSLWLLGRGGGDVSGSLARVGESPSETRRDDSAASVALYIWKPRLEGTWSCIMVRLMNFVSDGSLTLHRAALLRQSSLSRERHMNKFDARLCQLVS